MPDAVAEEISDRAGGVHSVPGAGERVSGAGEGEVSGAFEAVRRAGVSVGGIFAGLSAGARPVHGGSCGRFACVLYAQDGRDGVHGALRGGERRCCGKPCARAENLKWKSGKPCRFS